MRKKVLNFCLFLFVLFLLSACDREAKNDKEQAFNSSLNLSAEEGLEKTKEEEIFNQSGRAKAILKEEDLWQFYEDKKAAFSLQYPHNVVLADEEKIGDYSLSVVTEPIEGLVGTMGFNEETALKNAASLARGEYGAVVDWPLEVSKKVREIGSVNAQEFMVLSRFEVCDVTFERKLYFLNNDYQVIISLKIPKENVIDSMPEFFQKDNQNCGDTFVWDLERQDDFYLALKSGEGAKEVQDWFQAFERIVASIEFFDSKTSLESEMSNFEKLQGTWLSVDDDKSFLVFKNDKQISYYEKEIMSEDEFFLSDDETGKAKDSDGAFLIVAAAEGEMKYSIVELDDNDLVLTYLSRGNTLHYKRK